MRKKDASVRVLKLTYSALYLAIALVLPFLTGQIPQIGSMLCPMHIPALLCGFVCGWPWLPGKIKAGAFFRSHCGRIDLRHLDAAAGHSHCHEL